MVRGEQVQALGFRNEVREGAPRLGEDLAQAVEPLAEVPDWPPENIEELAKRFEDHY